MQQKLSKQVVLLVSSCFLNGLLFAQGGLDPKPTASSAGQVSASGPQLKESHRIAKLNANAMAWAQLSPDKQNLLKPLEKEWDGFSTVQKKRWLVLANEYPKMTDSQRERFEKLMNVSPDARKVIRESYKKSKELTPSEKREKWEYYQSLSPEEKQKFRDAALKTHSKNAVVDKKLDQKQDGLGGAGKSPK